MAEAANLEERHLDSSIIRESLGQILLSSGFKESTQLQTLLKYLVEESLGGHDDALKERIIGISVFNRRADYDTADDPIVRSRMGHLRKRLAHYYESEEARGSAIQIVIPNGSYRPSFIFRPEENNRNRHRLADDKSQVAVFDGDQENSKPESAPIVSSSSRAVRWRGWGITTAVSCALLIAAWAAIAKWQKSELDLFWGPLLESKKAVLLYTGTVDPVYIAINRTSPSGNLESAAQAPSQSSLEGQTVTGGDFRSIPGGLAAPGDIAADMKVAALMNTYNRSLSLRSGQSMPFVDLEGSPAVLIGAYDNYWTMDLAQGLPIFFDRGLRIRERGGQHRVWTTAAGPDTTITEDYAVIFRLLDSKTGGPVIAISGLTTCGTQAAAEFVTDPIQLKKLASIPRKLLKTKNLEFVLHTSLVNCTPTSVDVVAQQVW